MYCKALNKLFRAFFVHIAGLFITFIYIDILNIYLYNIDRYVIFVSQTRNNTNNKHKN